MNDPVGPLPASVYWRRRMVAVVVALLGTFGLFWLLTSALLPPGVEDPATGRTAHVEQPSVSPAPGTEVVGALPSSPVTPEPGAPGMPAGAPPAGPGQGPLSAGPATPGVPPGAGPADETVRPDPTAYPPAVVPPAGPSPATGPPPCTDQMISVSAETGAPQYRAGDRPVLRLVVANTSGQPCVRDLDGAQQEIVVWSGDGRTRLWSSNDCVNPSSNDLRTLVPGQPVAFAVTWSGLGSVPGCTTERDRVPPGAYRVLTRLDGVVSAPAPLLLNP